MAQLSSRVRVDPFSASSEVLDDSFAVECVRGKWRIYECSSEYSTTSGGFLVKGKAVRRYDPDVDFASEGKIAQFASKEEAVAYWEKWLRGKKAAK